MSEPVLEQSSLKQDLILDTCILGYLGDKILNPLILEYLTELIGRGFELAISEITCFELLSENNTAKENEGVSLLALFKRYLVDLSVLVSAAQLSTVYKVHANVEKKSLPVIEVPDKIIASTTIKTGSLVLTANTNDFPRPLFSEAEEKHIIFKEKGKTKMLVLQILRPNYSVIGQRFSERDK